MSKPLLSEFNSRTAFHPYSGSSFRRTRSSNKRYIKIVCLTTSSRTLHGVASEAFANSINDKKGYCAEIFYILSNPASEVDALCSIPRVPRNSVRNALRMSKPLFSEFNSRTAFHPYSEVLLEGQGPATSVT
ncbi:hypothetical protein CDAR_527901 [Caerostris darwini]|uniref:Uncharacterized protein n=1 Tax=Caerostris darwini TaxID=1538125 RepID=A0AAV4QT89_9ARAC|nr:hypothetical protein CDAR_527901 [Caerostris darwini]